MLAVDEGALDSRRWDHPLWASVPAAPIDQFHANSSSHHPPSTARLLHTHRAIYVKFEVQDRYVVTHATKYMDKVYKDSCVEIFLRPIAAKGYFNFEFNCGGTMWSSFVEDWRRNGDGLGKFTPLPWELAKGIEIEHSLPRTVFPERTEPTPWWLGARIPIALMEPYLGPLGTLDDQIWTGNFFKCAEHSSHPHWASWSPIGEEINFHLPDKFGEIQFCSKPPIVK